MSDTIFAPSFFCPRSSVADDPQWRPTCPAASRLTFTHPSDAKSAKPGKRNVTKVCPVVAIVLRKIVKRLGGLSITNAVLPGESWHADIYMIVLGNSMDHYSYREIREAPLPSALSLACPGSILRYIPRHRWRMMPHKQ